MAAIAAGVAVAFIVAGCGAGEGAAVATVVRDSAGITIVENRADPVPESGWRLSAAPRVAIGVLDGAAEYQLDRVVGALVLAGGTIVIGNGGTNEIRFYDAEGRHSRSVGRDGEGPGEFRGLGAIHLLAGDSILATDMQLRRISIFDREGRFSRSFLVQAAGEGMFARPLGPLGGALLVSTGRFITAQSTGGVRYDKVPYLRYSMAGEPLDTIGLFAGNESYVQADGRTVTVTGLAFGRTTQTRLRDGRIYIATQSDHEIGVYRDDGSLERVVRLDGERRPVTESDIQRLRAERIESATDDNWRRITERMLRDMPFPDLMPAHGRIEVDAEGNLWVQEYRLPEQETPVTWTVFDAEARLVGTIETPARFRIHEIGSDYVLGIARDELDVEYAHLYALER